MWIKSADTQAKCLKQNLTSLSTANIMVIIIRALLYYFVKIGIRKLFLNHFKNTYNAQNADIGIECVQR